ncbi:MAG: CDP-diacylglycerol--glycerol-3-phosphate 3-phosphatidyltransferase [Phycisphaerales bacterium JB043]
MRRHIPNALTMARLVMTGVLVIVLALFDATTNASTTLLAIALALFIGAALTDALDGYLARRWNVVSVFGRIVDPTADKLLVLGAFIMLASPGFTRIGGESLTGVHSWMVVVILARELMVTVIRAVVEQEGSSFAAVWTGKLKMVVQSIAVPLILLVLVLSYEGALSLDKARFNNAVIAWIVVVITIVSGIDYAYRGAIALRKSEPVA